MPPTCGQHDKCVPGKRKLRLAGICGGAPSYSTVSHLWVNCPLEAFSHQQSATRPGAGWGSLYGSGHWAPPEIWCFSCLTLIPALRSYLLFHSITQIFSRHRLRTKRCVIRVGGVTKKKKEKGKKAPVCFFEANKNKLRRQKCCFPPRPGWVAWGRMLVAAPLCRGFSHIGRTIPRWKQITGFNLQGSNVSCFYPLNNFPVIRMAD